MKFVCMLVKNGVAIWIDRRRLLLTLGIAPQADILELFRGSETIEYRKQIYDRFQCRALPPHQPLKCRFPV